MENIIEERFWSKTPGVIVNKKTGEFPKMPRVDCEYITIKEWHETFYITVMQEFDFMLKPDEALEVKCSDGSIGKLILEHTLGFDVLMHRKQAVFVIDNNLLENEIIVSKENKSIKFTILQ